jgi:DNA invertase Pin-like site-specific DNA recombinase
MDKTPGSEQATLVVALVDPEIVRQLRALHALGRGARRIARELGIARNSVRRYLREGAAAETQTRPPRTVVRPAALGRGAATFSALQGWRAGAGCQ